MSMNKKDLFKDRTPEEIEEMLRSNRDIIEHDTRRVEFLPGEIQQFKNDLADSSATLFELSAELDRVKARFKEQMKPHQKTIARCAQSLAEKTYEAELELFGIADHEGGTMDFYNIAGEYIYSRPLKAAERQASIHNLNHKTA